MSGILGCKGIHLLGVYSQQAEHTLSVKDRHSEMRSNPLESRVPDPLGVGPWISHEQYIAPTHGVRDQGVTLQRLLQC